jgi:hypothetical protein
MGKIFLIMFVLLLILSSGCGSSSPTEPGIVPDGTKILVANSLGETLSRFTFNNGTYVSQNDIAPTGQAPNQMLARNGVGYVVNSMSNSILAFDLTTLNVLFEASVGAGKSPFNMGFINDDEIIVTDFAANDCVRMNVDPAYSSDRIIATIPLPGSSQLPRDTGVTETKAYPESVAVSGSTAYVSIANLNTTTFTAGGPGMVAMINLGSNQVQSTFQTTGRDTLGLFINPIKSNEMYILSAGDIDTITWEYEGNGKIDIFNLNTKGITDSVDVDGAPYEMVIAPDGIAYVTDGKEGKVMTFSTLSYAIGASITISEGSGKSYASGIALGSNNLLYVLEFNNDELIVVDLYSSNQVVERITTGDGPDALVVME